MHTRDVSRFRISYCNSAFKLLLASTLPPSCHLRPTGMDPPPPSPRSLLMSTLIPPSLFSHFHHGYLTNASSSTQSKKGRRLAGTTVDLMLYPLDTLKTHLQSSSPAAGCRACPRASGPWLPGRRRRRGGRPHGRCVAERDRGVRGESADGGCEAAGASVVVPECLGGLAARCPKHPLLVGKAVDELYRRWSITVMREILFTVIQLPLWGL